MPAKILMRVGDTLTFRHMPIRRKFTLFTIGVSFWYLVIGGLGLAQVSDVQSMRAIVAGLVIAHVLLVAFAWSATRSLTRPLRAINGQVREITSGTLTDLEHIQIHAHDEVGELSARFNGLLDVLGELATFKKVIEHDDTTDEVCARLSQVFASKGLPAHQIFTLDGDRTALRRVLPQPQAWCGDALTDAAVQCRAFKTATTVASEAFPGICKHFDAADCEHRCVPLMLGGSTRGVVQFVYGGQLGPVRSEFKARCETVLRFVSEAQPVLEARRLTDTLRETAIRDGLTGVHNRRYLQEIAGQLAALCRRRKSSLGIVLCDIDHFKRVNDDHGHANGDLVLREVAGVLQGQVRASDSVVRYGGEEFLLLLHDTDAAGALLVAERVREAVAARAMRAGLQTLHVSISLGIAEFPRDNEVFWEVVKHADQALYQAKRTGRNRSVVWTSQFGEPGEAESIAPAKGPVQEQAVG
jgi:diguanylate cyclase (GGDEF)-like protein